MNAMLLPLLLACAPQLEDSASQASFRAVTFNVGSSGAYDPAASGAFGADQAAMLDEWYGNGLSWVELIDETAAWFAQVDADIVAFQEVFWPGECATIPVEYWPGFVCEEWTAGAPTVVERVLGTEWQIACNLDHPDKCLAVRDRFGTLDGCNESVCLDGLDGAELESCGSGARVGRARVNRADGTTLTVVGVHGSSGVAAADQECRVRQFQQVFEDLDGDTAASGDDGGGEEAADGDDGTGEAAANGEINLILGDFNTDPGRMTEVDPSAAYLADRGGSAPFHFITEVGPDSEPTYVLVNIDHVLADTLGGACWHAGINGHSAVSTMGIFDHLPAVCDVAGTAE